MRVSDSEAAPIDNLEARVGGNGNRTRSPVSDARSAPGPGDMFTGAPDELLVVHNTFLELCKMGDTHPVNADRFVSAPALLGGVYLPIIDGQNSDSAKKETHANPPTKSCSDLGPEELTTLMMRNIPTRTSAKALLDLIVATFGRSLESLVDFVYLPIDFKTNKNLGYCFINFTEATDAVDLIRILNGRKYLFCDTSEKQLQISYSNRQGYSKNLEVFTQTKMLDTWPEVFRPLAKVNGALVPVRSDLLAQIVGDVGDHRL
jgi:hypothetical protein